MSVPPPSPAARPPRLVGHFVASQALAWLLAAPILGAAVARLAVWAQNFRAPLVIFPLLVGCGLGLLLVALMRLGRIGHRATIWSGVIAAVAVAVAGQHYFSFLDFKAALMAEKKPQGISLEAFEAVRETRPDAAGDFAGFMHRQAALGRSVTAAPKPGGAEFTLRGAAAWASWAIDGLLVLLSTATIIYFACRTPYCSLCRSWYRTTRTGPLAAETARRVAEAAALASEELTGAARYRLSHCASGCGPSRLELAYGGQGIEAWLAATQREQVVRVLDGESGSQEGN